jgi:hypothetical protein
VTKIDNMRAVFGLVVAAAVGALLAVAYNALSSAVPGDRLAFLGSLVGSALAVVGSVGVINWQENRKSAAQRRFVQAVVVEALDAVATVENGNGSGEQQRALFLAIDRASSIEKLITLDSLQFVKAFEEMRMIDGVMRAAVQQAAKARAMYHTSMNDETKASLADALRPVRAQLEKALAHLRQA